MNSPTQICSACAAGSLLSFDWDYAQTTERPEEIEDLAVFEPTKQLRYGTLYHCRVCGQSWYLYGTPARMNFVLQEKLAFIEQWQKHPQRLNRSLLKALKKIGPTPPDIYSNGSEYEMTPCMVVTKKGEKIELALVCKQKHAPYEEWREVRFASEIAEIHPSPYALPRAIREATAEAEEIRMSFAPTLIKLPDESYVVLNWTENFFVWPNCPAGEVRLGPIPFDWDVPYEFYMGTPNVVYFVADVE